MGCPVLLQDMLLLGCYGMSGTDYAMLLPAYGMSSEKFLLSAFSNSPEPLVWRHLVYQYRPDVALVLRGRACRYALCGTEKASMVLRALVLSGRVCRGRVCRYALFGAKKADTRSMSFYLDGHIAFDSADDNHPQVPSHM
eukprot:2847266-Rhodomonas_salina.3